MTALAAPLPRAGASPFARAAAWLRARPWTPVVAVLALWALMPEVRRLVDWRLGYNSISLLSVVPLAALVATALPLVYGRALHGLNARLATCAWLWLGGFTFALGVAATTGTGLASALYAYADFVLPAAFGLWVASLDVPVTVLYERVATFLLRLATPLSVYAAFQFVAPPAWDVAWMLHAKITSIGVPLPYQLRPFSSLNSPGIFADLIVVAILLNLPRLRAPKPGQLVQFAICVGALALTMVRSDWLALAAAVLCYVAISPNRARNLTVLTGVAALCGVLAVSVPALLGGTEAGTSIANRLQTFTNLNSDVSYNERARYLDAPLAEAIANPLGAGLGVIGTAAKLGDSGLTRDFDNGYIARFTEMGYFGTACYLLAVGAALALALSRRRAFQRGGRPDLAAIAAAVAAVQLALILLDVSSDHHSALNGIFFWLTLALVGMRPAAERPAAERAA